MATARFMAWQHQHGRSVATSTQADLERYSQLHRGRALALIPFLTWAHRHDRIRPGLSLPPRPQTQPAVTLADSERWAQVDMLLHDETIRLYSRVAGLLLLLFAQPLARICRMRTDQIHEDPHGRLTLTFDSTPIELPEPLDALIRQQLAHRGQASYVSRPAPWLFPGGIPGKHLATENIRSQLVARGIQPLASRHAAMFHLAAQIPSPVLGEILGVTPSTATRWAALASRDWGSYTAQRAAALYD